MPLAAAAGSGSSLIHRWARSFSGLDEPVMLRWQPVKELAPDEYYEVTVEYDYIEGMYTEKLATAKRSLRCRRRSTARPTARPSTGIYAQPSDWRIRGRPTDRRAGQLRQPHAVSDLGLPRWSAAGRLEKLS